MPTTTRLKGDKMRANAGPPFGPGFSKAEIEAADTLAITTSDFKDEGPDFTKFELEKDGKVIATKNIPGY